MQLGLLATLLLVAVFLGAWIGVTQPVVPPDWLVSPTTLRFAIVLVTVGFAAYAIEKDLHLRKLSRLLVDERVRSAALSSQLHQLDALIEAGRAVSGAIELSVALDTILRLAVELLEADSGSIMQLEGDHLIVTATVGNPEAEGKIVRLGEGVAGRVALTRQPVLLDGSFEHDHEKGMVERARPVNSAASVPLLSSDGVLGVLSVNAAPTRSFDERDLRVAALFGQQAATAISQSRLRSADRTLVAQMLRIGGAESEFLGLLSHQLRTPVTAILAAARTAKRPQATRQWSDLMEIIERQGLRAAEMLDEILASVEFRHRFSTPTERVDVGLLARIVAAQGSGTGEAINVEGPETLWSVADKDSIRRILEILVDNARRYGDPPISIRVASEADLILISVSDSGPGIPQGERASAFEHFRRLGGTRGQPGLGLGLPVARGLARACGGDAWIPDSPVVGTTVCVRLPGNEDAVVDLSPSEFPA